MTGVARFLGELVKRNQAKFGDFCKVYRPALIGLLDGAQTSWGEVMYWALRPKFLCNTALGDICWLRFQSSSGEVEGTIAVAFLMYHNNPSKKPIFDALQAGKDLAPLRHLLFVGSKRADEVEQESVYVLCHPWVDWDVVDEVESTLDYEDATVEGQFPIDMPVYTGMSVNPSKRRIDHMSSSVNRRVENAARDDTWVMHVAFDMREPILAPGAVVPTFVTHCCEHMCIIAFGCTDGPLGGLNVNTFDPVMRYTLISGKNIEVRLRCLDAAFETEPRLRCPVVQDADGWRRTLRAVSVTASHIARGHGKYAKYRANVTTPNLRAWAGSTVYGSKDGRFDLQPISESHLYVNTQGYSEATSRTSPYYPPMLMEHWVAAVSEAAEKVCARW
ncbi:uncharacterized protein LOC62_03G004095 [Vanrija pseudolonga]|uniref:Uncharacterized protein n=1 Tax=Vanrija pseudolonga TaxID=143232 RepID=A0AAF0Y5J9_9TREE|nr:hypothetical protein LOC62_03G004095 [Vanrija pseudolonga]